MNPFPDQSEDDLQVQVANYCRFAVLPSVLWCHVPNGGKRSKAEAARFKAMGVRAGWPDLQFIRADGVVHFIELKTRTGRKSEGQEAFQADCIRLGHPYVIARSLDDVIVALKGWGFIRSNPL